MDMSLALHPGARGDREDPPLSRYRGLALRNCLVENYDLLRRRLAGYLGSYDQATDCLHEAWLRLGDMTISSAVEDPPAYVYRVARNLAVDNLRRSQKWPQAADAEIDAICDPAPGPERIAEARSRIRAVDHALRGLPYRHQAILVAVHGDELARQEVARRHGMSVRGVDAVLRQAVLHCAEAAC